ncbi:hypothetical protein BKH46_08790 [Helicobacter sp. 12S02634-8]|uniref:hypothetical protein n=1 Tax=Helicobacter sp. 12S02634-8 TaxID=1476199 RepID=UPI000BA5288A|nr:hypothetical protein [Helicobacter sp. 12S02634-8]PAF46133.1 hypothetical protein BKH46_08790 [Helicobacter sp. 12S02634-8]
MFKYMGEFIRISINIFTFICLYLPLVFIFSWIPLAPFSLDIAGYSAGIGVMGVIIGYPLWFMAIHFLIFLIVPWGVDYDWSPMDSIYIKRTPAYYI